MTTSDLRAHAAELKIEIDDKAKKADIVAAIRAAEAVPDLDPMFSIDDLRPSARHLFGISESTYDAATNRLSGEYTVKAMRQEIDKWLKEGY
ncbi:MAG: hypothetical protein PHS57_05750 [Alphaproteobacteria bacterium]|nr:hypothetical protein [Alphaproteobacteria bacterium]